MEGRYHGMHPSPAPSSLGLGIKILEKSLLGGGGIRNVYFGGGLHFLFGGGGLILCGGGGSSCDFEVKIKIA